jgi:hypothetical protein
VGITTSFFGQPVDGTTELIRYTYLGDSNLDGCVNALDFNSVAANFGNAAGKEWYQGDYNYDGFTNSLDFDALATNYNLTLPPPAPALSPALGTLVPEPVGSVVLVAPLFLRRRRS